MESNFFCRSFRYRFLGIDDNCTERKKSERYKTLSEATALKDVRIKEEIVRSDETGRLVRVQFISRNGKMDWIRIITFLNDEIKLRSDYYKDEDSKKFEKVRRAEKNRQQKLAISNLVNGK